MLEHDRQGRRRETLQLDVLARADFIFKELRRLLMVRHLPRHIGEVEFGAARRLQLVVHNGRRMERFRCAAARDPAVGGGPTASHRVSL
jgi:hypothetical protein